MIQEKWYSIQEAAQFLGISTVTLRRYIKKHRISAYQIAGRYRFTREGLEAFLEACRLRPPRDEGQEVSTEAGHEEALKDNPGHFREAGVLADEVIKGAPRRIRALYIKAFTASRLGKYEEAEEYYRRILKHQPKESAAYLFLGLLFQEIGKQNQALEMWREVVNIDKTSDFSEVARYHITRALRVS